jgi:hypothetical protein
VESHGGDDVGWGKFLTRSPELYGSPTSRYIRKQIGGMDEGVRTLHISIWYASMNILHDVKSYTTWGLRIYYPSEGRCAADFYRPCKSIASAGFEPATLGSIGKHTTHYTTEATK